MTEHLIAFAELAVMLDVPEDDLHDLWRAKRLPCSWTRMMGLAVTRRDLPAWLRAVRDDA